MSPESAVPYDGGADARSFEPVEGTERDSVTFGDPIHDRDRLLLPDFNDDHQLVGFTAIGWPGAPRPAQAAGSLISRQLNSRMPSLL
jgi:hypothetical protein